MPNIYEFDASAVSMSMFITLIDKQGNKYRLQFDQRGGFVINKNGAQLVDAITVHPICVNEVRIN